MAEDRTPTRSHRALVAAALGLVALGFWDLGAEPSALAKEHASKAVFEYGCRVQVPQRFLERRSFLDHGTLDLRKQSNAVRYLAERYGNVDSEGTSRWN